MFVDPVSVERLSRAVARLSLCRDRRTVDPFCTKDGAEIDFIIERDGHVIPVGVKWTARPKPSDAAT